jgi:hypothetical protein
LLSAKVDQTGIENCAQAYVNLLAAESVKPKDIRLLLGEIAQQATLPDGVVRSPCTKSWCHVSVIVVLRNAKAATSVFNHVSLVSSSSKVLLETKSEKRKKQKLIAAHEELENKIREKEDESRSNFVAGLVLGL